MTVKDVCKKLRKKFPPNWEIQKKIVMQSIHDGIITNPDIDTYEKLFNAIADIEDNLLFDRWDKMYSYKDVMNSYIEKGE